MAVSTLRPSGTTVNDGTVTGAANAHSALSDDSDSSYVTLDSHTGGGPASEVWYGDIGDLTLPAGAVIKSVAVRARLAATAGSHGFSATLLTPPSGPNIATGTITVTWSTPTTVTIATAASSSLSDGLIDAARLSVAPVLSSSPVRAIRVYALYVDVTHVAQPTLTVDAPTGTFTDTNQPSVIWTPELAPAVTVATPAGRTPGDCFRIATALAWGQALGFGYEDTPAEQYPNGGEQHRAYQNWAAIRGLRWWRSFESAPTRGVWLALVDSPGGYATHVVVMNGRRLYADPANHFTPKDITPFSVRGAFVLKRADDPWWTAPVEFWRLPAGYRDDRRTAA